MNLQKHVGVPDRHERVPICADRRGRAGCASCFDAGEGRHEEAYSTGCSG